MHVRTNGPNKRVECKSLSARLEAGGTLCCPHAHPCIPAGMLAACLNRQGFSLHACTVKLCRPAWACMYRAAASRHPQGLARCGNRPAHMGLRVSLNGSLGNVVLLRAVALMGSLAAPRRGPAHLCGASHTLPPCARALRTLSRTRAPHAHTRAHSPLLLATPQATSAARARASAWWPTRRRSRCT